MDPDIRALFQVLVDGQSQTDRSVRELTTVLSSHVEMFASHVASSGARFDRLDARMTRIEENLDGLIRAVTRDHSNGKSH